MSNEIYTLNNLIKNHSHLLKSEDRSDLENMLSQQTNVSDAPSAKPKKPRSKKASNQSTSNGRINKFDSMTEKNLHKED